MVLTEEKLNANFLLWTKKLAKYGCYSESMVNDIGDKLKRSSYSMPDNTGSSYDGAMIDVVLNVLCTLAFQLNEKGISDKHGLLKTDGNSLMKVCLLQHISKAEMFVNETEQWRIKRGMAYTFNDNLPTNLKCGERSAFMCMKYGIPLTEEEYDAMKSIDKEDDKIISYATPLSTIVKFANTLTAIEMRIKWENEHRQNNTIEK